MTRLLPRTNFHSSTLLRCLADLSIVDAGDAENAFAEKLGRWIHFADAITLSAVHNDNVATLPDTASAARRAAHAMASAECDRIQSLLTNSVIKSCAATPGTTHLALPVPDPGLSTNIATAYLPYRRFYEAHQRDMEMTIQPLRVNTREAVAKASPRLRKLAELDAMFEKILRDRESKLLSKIPVLLRKRFEHLFKQHQATLADSQQPDSPACWMQKGGWLARFCNDMQMLLLAEVELRLQPTTGLLDALRQDTQ